MISKTLRRFLFQTGYLTIKKITIEAREETYHLSYPNKEVRDSFLTYLFEEFSQKDIIFSSRFLKRIDEFRPKIIQNQNCWKYRN